MQVLKSFQAESGLEPRSVNTTPFTPFADMGAIEVSQRGSSHAVGVKKFFLAEKRWWPCVNWTRQPFNFGLQLLIRPPMTDSLERM